MKIDHSMPVMLTGATGYVGGHIAKKLMEKGHKVHAPVRNPDSAEKLKYLNEIASNTDGSIEYFKADLLDEGSYLEAMKGCELVIHTASPFITTTKDPQKDLVDPALKGTTNVMQSVKETESVKRVVLTSSCVAMYGDAKDTLDYPDQMMREDIWNTTSSLTQSPYNYSKTVAEKKAWNMTEGQDRFDLVVINPSFVLGPGINPNGTSESFSVMKQLGDGSFKTGVPELNIGCVDVRDVAEAHYRAGFTPSASGRNICSAENLSFLKLADMLRPNYGKDFPLPKSTAPKWLLWLVGPMFGVTRQFVRDNVGFPWQADNSKIKKELGMEFKSIEESVNEFFAQLEGIGVFSKK